MCAASGFRKSLLVLTFFIVKGLFGFSAPNGIVFLVDAPALDFSSLKSTIVSIASSQKGEFGHAWILLKRTKDGKTEYLEGGHSGEGSEKPYLDAFFDACQDRLPNPVSCFFDERRDGYFEKGSGGHRPTFAAFIPLSVEQLEQIEEMLGQYCFSRYHLKESQCTTFIREIAALLGHFLDIEETIAIEKELSLFGKRCVLWEDSQYARFTLPTPSRLEVALKTLVSEGKAEEALLWYRQYRGFSRRPFFTLSQKKRIFFLNTIFK